MSSPAKPPMKDRLSIVTTTHLLSSAPSTSVLESSVKILRKSLDVEGWVYRTPHGMLSIGFRRASGSTDPAMAGGDFIFVPTNRRQASSTATLLRTDRTTVPAPREVRAWTEPICPPTCATSPWG